MISVIVNVYDNQKRIVRCINSIKRQTYENVEIIVLTKDSLKDELCDVELKEVNADVADKCKDISKAVSMASGEYVYFCSSDSMLTYNTLEEMAKQAGDPQALVYTSAYTPDGQGYVSDKKINASICGKLFLREKLYEIVHENVKTKPGSELEVVMEYLKTCDKLICAEEASVYEAKEDNLFGSIAAKDMSAKYFKNLLKTIMDNCKDIKIRNYLTAGVGEIIEALMSDTSDMMLYTSDLLHEDIWLNYVIARKTVKSWWTKLNTENDNKSYKKFVEYLSFFDDSLVAEMLLNDCGINKSIFEIMKNNEQDVFASIMYNIEREQKCTLPANAVISKVQKEEYSYELSGVQLAEFVVDKFQNGNLGLKTILKSLKAWIKYKI